MHTQSTLIKEAPQEFYNWLLTQPLLIQWYYLKAIKTVSTQVFNQMVTYSSPDKTIFKNIINNMYNLEGNNSTLLPIGATTEQAVAILPKYEDYLALVKSILE